MLKRWTQAIMVAGMLMLTVLNGQEKKVKDQAEYDLIQSIQKEPDAKKKVDLIHQWKEKYPTSDFKIERLQALVQAEQAAQNAAGMRDAAQELIREDPKGLAGYLFMNLLTLSMNDTSEASLANSEKAAQGMLDLLKDFPKPANLTDAQWDTEKKNQTLNALKSLAFVKMSRNDYEGAEAQYLEILKIAPNLADVSLNAATAVLRQKKVERQPVAMFHYARAATVTGPGALPEAAKKQAMDFFRKNYIILRENDSKIDDFIALAKSTAIPPPDLKIESVSVVMARDLEKLKETNPQLALWIQVKKELVAPEGESYFADKLKDTALPKLKGKVVSVSPATRPTKVVIALEDDTTGEMTLVFAPALGGPADPGTEIEFDGGVPKAFTKDPFMLTVNVEASKLTGWPAAAARPRPAPRKK